MLDISQQKTDSHQILEGKKFPSSDISQKETLKMPSLGGTDETNQSKSIAIFAVIIAFLFVAAFAYLFFLKSSRTSQINTSNAKLNQLNAEIKSNELDKIEAKALRYKTGFSSINSFLNQSLSWYTFFNQLEKILPKNATLSSIALSQKNSLSLKGETDNYDTVSKLIMSLKNSQRFGEIKINSLGRATSANQEVQTTKINFEITAKTNNNTFKEEQK